MQKSATRRSEPVTDDRSSVTVLMAAVLVVALTLAVGLATAAGRIVEAERTRSVADASALAEVTGGSTGSDAVAAANGAEVTSREREGEIRVVTVSVGAASASAAATGLRQ